MKITSSFFAKFVVAMSAFAFAGASALAQAPVMAQVPFASAFAGNTSGALVAPCTTGNDIPVYTGSSNSHYGNGCAATDAIVSTPYGDAVDSQGNVYISDEAHDEVRVVYNGGATAAALIQAANSSSSITPVVGNIYGVGGGLTGAITATNTDTSLACGNVAGNGDALNSSGDGCPATQAYINGPYAVAVDSDGDIFVADRGGSKIHVIYAGGALAAALITLETPAGPAPVVGSMYLIAGGSSGYVDAVLATAGKIKSPGGVAVDSNGNVYIADTGNNAIRMINGPNTTNSVNPGFIHTIGGNCTSTACTALATVPPSNTAADGAGFISPQGIAVDGYGNVYVADDSGTQAGGSSLYPSVRLIYAGGTNNPAASFVCLENGSQGYNTISGSCSASTLTAGNVYALAGAQTNLGATSGNGVFGSAVQFARLTAIAVDKNGNVYTGDYASPSVVVEINANTGYATFLAGGGQATSGAVTVGSYCAPAATSGLTATDVYGDGCPGPQAYFHHIEGNIAVDASGNVYYSDSSNNLVRKLSFSGPFTPAAVGVPATQQFAFTLLPATTSLTLGTPSFLPTAFADAGDSNETCTNGTALYGAPSATQNTTCVLDVTFTPAVVGAIPGAINITGAVSGSPTTQLTSSVSGIGQGAGIAIDPATSAAIGSVSGGTPRGVAVDASGNVYTDYAGTNNIISTAGVLAATPGTGLDSPYQIAVDGAGDVFVADGENNRIAEFAAGSSAATTAVSGLSSPEGVALDAAGNMYIADSGHQRVLYQPNGNGVQTVLGSGFEVPVSVAVDANDNVYVADLGAGDIVKIAAGTGVQTTVLGSIHPTAVAVDAAGDIYYADQTAQDVVEIPVNGASSIIVSTGLVTPSGLALDANGNLYVADTSLDNALYFDRNASTQTFASLSSVISANLTNIGNENYTETADTFTQTDSADFGVTATPCDFANPLAAGANCAITAQFTPGATGTLTDTATFSGNAVNASSVTLNLSGTSASATVATTTTLGALSIASPTYGQSPTITATITPASGSTAPTGNVTFTIDGVAQAPAALTNGAYTLTLSSLSAGSHSVSATYAGAGNFSGSTTTTSTTFSVSPLAITATDTTTGATAVYGQAIPTITGTLSGVLPADTANVAPVFSVTASVGSSVGSYPVSVSLTGSASANYTATLSAPASLSITQATVTLAVANATRVYGAANPTFTGTFTGVLVADQSNVAGVYSTTATASSPISATYPITATSLTGSAAGNYKLGTVTPGTLTLTAAPLTTTATVPPSVSYGQPIPTIAGSALTGVLAADQGNVTAVFSTTATSSSPVGTYPISVALTGSAAPNYTVSLTTPAVLTIVGGSVAVAVNNATIQYGAALPTFSGVLTGVNAPDVANVAAVYSTTATSTSAPGTYSITATGLTGSAASNYKLGAVTPGTLTVAKANTTITLQASTLTVDEGDNVTFTATVASSTTGTPTGSVTFYSGTTNIGTGTISGGVAAVTTYSLAFGVQSITAVYGGSTDYSTSTSSAVSESVIVPVVAPTLSASSITISSSGGSGTVTLTASAQGGYTGTATYSCSNLPADMTCTFAPPTSTFTSTNTTATTVLTVSTKGATTAMMRTPELPAAPGSRHNLPLLAFCFPGAFLGYLGFRKRKHQQGLQRLMVLAILFAGLAGLAGLTGCGSSSGGSSNTSAGTYNIQVQVTAGTVQTVPLTVIVQ